MKTVLKVLVAVCIIAVSSPAFALFDNGGFETGDFSGWSFDYGVRSSSGITWGKTNNFKSAVIDSTTPMQTGQTLDVNPYNGTYMARINNFDNNLHATKIYQSDILEAADIYPGSTLYVNWGAMLPDPANHDTNEQPYFKILVTVGGTTQTFDAYGNQHTGWTYAGTNYAAQMYYKSGTYAFDLSGLNVGTNVLVEMVASDCSLTGHGGFAFLDGIGTTYEPPSGVPEPATMLLLGFGLVGAAGLRRRFTK